MKMTPSFKILYTSATLASQKKAERNYCFDGVDAFNMNPPRATHELLLTSPVPSGSKSPTCSRRLLEKQGVIPRRIIVAILRPLDGARPRLHYNLSQPVDLFLAVRPESDQYAPPRWPRSASSHTNGVSFLPPGIV